MLNKNAIESISVVCGTEGYKKFLESGCGMVRYSGFMYRRSIPTGIEIIYNIPLVDYLIGENVLGIGTISGKIEAINNIDPELYDIGELFCRGFDSSQYARFFRLYKDQGTGKYCIKFHYEENLSLSEIDPRLELIFTNKKNCI